MQIAVENLGSKPKDKDINCQNHGKFLVQKGNCWNLNQWELGKTGKAKNGTTSDSVAKEPVAETEDENAASKQQKQGCN
ncbi:hypothetical protein JHK86_006241 [Glycine max]|nr:hypothetical protein JHK86_006241 [Glycine max]